MTTTKRFWQQVGPLEAAALIVAGIALALVIAGQVDPVALIILLILGYFVYMARGILRQARRFRPVEPPNTWLITLVAESGADGDRDRRVRLVSDRGRNAHVDSVSGLHRGHDRAAPVAAGRDQ